MKRQIKIFDDGYIYELKEDQPVFAINTEGKVQRLIEALQFTAGETFTVVFSEVSFGDSVPTSRSSTRQINSEGIQLIKAFEGLYLDAYLDPVGIPTVGYGHTNDVYMGMSITEAEADQLLQQDLERFEAAVEDAVEVEINENQFSALVSFSFNLGAGSLFRSTLLKLLNQGEFEKAAQEFPRWNQAGYQPLLGLTRRRLAERALFLSKPWKVFQKYELLKLTSPRIQGEYVRYIQQALQKTGLELDINGVFNEQTDKAAKQFQEQKGLVPDGLVGPITVAALGL